MQPHQHPLHCLFAPQHLMVIGASERPSSFGERVFSALLHQPFNGTLTPINPRHKTIAGLTAHFHLNRTPNPQGLVLILTDPDSYDSLIKTCVKKNIPHVLIMLRPHDLSPEQSEQLQKSLHYANSKSLNITVCTTQGYGIPALGLYTHLAQILPPQGKIAIVGSSPNFSADIIQLLRHLPVGFSHFIDIAPPFSHTAPLIDYLQHDTQSNILLVQYNPHEPATALFSALRQTARRKTIILHHTQHTDTEQQLLLQHLAERCGILLTLNDDQLIAALRAAHLPKKHHANRLHILSDRETGWLHNQAAQLHIDSHSAPAHLLPTYTGALQFCDAAVQLLQQDTCRALMIVPHHNWHNSEQATARQLARITTRQDKPVYLVSHYAEGLLAFSRPLDALQTFAAQQNLQQLKKTPLQIARPPLNHLHKPDLRNIAPLLPQTEALLKALQLPPIAPNPCPPSTLHYRHHAQYGVFLHAHHHHQQQTLLPPFTTQHARQLADFFTHKKLQAQLEQTLYTLNHLAYHLPHITNLQFHIDHHTLHTTHLHYQTEPTHPAPNLFAGYPPVEQPFFTLKNQHTVLIRALQPEDAEALQQFIQQLSDQSRKTRFMLASKELPPALLAQFCNLDYTREAAFIALDRHKNIIGLAQHSSIAFPYECEFGISISDHMQGQGLAHHLMQQLIAFATQQGYQHMSAEILANNTAMLNLAAKLGFELAPSAEDNSLCVANLPLSLPKKPRKLPLTQQILAPKT